MGSDLFLSLALLFLASADSSLAQKAASALEVEEGAPLTVECPLRVEQRARWRLDGREPPADVVPVSEAAAAGRLVARLHTARARLAHAGLYSCGPDEEQRVRVAVLPRRARPTPAPVPGADDSKAPATTEASAPSAAPALGVVLTLQYYDVGRPFALNCSDPEVKPGTPFFWKKNGTAIEELQELHGRYVLEEGGAVLRVTGRTHESDFGNYTCGLGGVTDQFAGWEVRGRPVAKLQPNNNVVEGQKLRMVCKVVGKPYPAVEWRVRNDSTDENRTELVTAVLGERVRFEPSEQGVPGAELVVEAAERNDAAVYVCIPLADEGVRAETTLRVKDKYAALWPFLGICAEVFVLCAIILIYEKRRTKPELDDSDTDNHDQKKS